MVLFSFNGCALFLSGESGENLNESCENRSPFEAVLRNFKYSLYPDLNIPLEEFEPQNPRYERINAKLEAFVTSHLAELRKYHLSQLKNLHMQPINLSDFMEVPIKSAPHSPAPFHIVKLLDPSQQIFHLLPSILLQEFQYSSKEMAEFYIRTGMGGWRFESKASENPEIWQIWLDGYTHAFLFEYDLSSGEARLRKQYLRKKPA